VTTYDSYCVRVLLVCTLAGCGNAANASSGQSDAPAKAAERPAGEGPQVQAAEVRTVEAEKPTLPARAADTACAAICANTKPLGCGSELGCLSICGEMRSAPVCVSELAHFLDCAAGRPTVDWECGDEDMPALRDNVCDVEQAVLAACIETHTEP
jgi:hypothetical protein